MGLYDRNKMFIRMQFSRDIVGVNADALDHLLYDIYKVGCFKVVIIDSSTV